MKVKSHFGEAIKKFITSNRDSLDMDTINQLNSFVEKLNKSLREGDPKKIKSTWAKARQYYESVRGKF